MTAYKVVVWLSPEQVAERLGVTRRTVYTWLRMGHLKGSKIANTWRVKEQHIEEAARK
jgi:excisionase family DNA binding protein